MFRILAIALFAAGPLCSADMWFPSLRQTDTGVRTLTRNSVGSTSSRRDVAAASLRDGIMFHSAEESSNWEKHVDNVISRGVLRMSLELDMALRKEPGKSDSNVIFSPVSIASALALVLLGSGGRTFEEAARVMGVASGVEIASRPHLIHEQFGRLLDKFSYLHLISRNSLPGNVGNKYFDGLELTAASGVFVQDGIPIAPTFRRVANAAYHSDVVSVDFQKKGEEAQKTINGWVSDRTNGHIKDIVPWRVAPPSTRVIFATALYFKGAWQFPFPEENTMPRSFYLGVYPKYVGGYPVKPENPGQGDSIKVQMMINALDELPYLERPELGFRALGLPYGLNNTTAPVATMYIVVPDDDGKTGVKSLHNLIKRMKFSDLESITKDAKPRPVIASIPRMKLSSSTSLRTSIASLGLPSLFDPVNANLSGVFEDSVTDKNVRPPGQQASRRAAKEDKLEIGPLFADDVRHRVELEITEKGTIASAATFVSLSRDGGTYKNFRADKPFLFFVHHAPSGLVLFWGTIVKPPQV